MPDKHTIAPENTAIRVALWRAIHVQADAPPHVLDDKIGLRLAAPDEGWHQRPDMDQNATKFFRASIVARARFIEDLMIESSACGINQYVILGAGLDTFAQRHPEVTGKIQIFEVDQPGPQEWKKRRLVELGYKIPESLHFVPVDFEAGDSWWEELVEASFDVAAPAVVVSTGVSMYLTREANEATLRQAAAMAPGSKFIMSFLMPEDLADPEVRIGLQMSAKGAKASGTPFISFFTPNEVLTMARTAGFQNVEHISSAHLGERYFSNRTDGLRPPTSAEELLVATT